MSAAAETEADREIVTVRVVDAPRATVWRAWTEAEHLARWWGPNGFASTFDVFDPRPGGAWRFTFHGPDGTDYRNELVYVALAAPERVVLDHLSGHRFRVTATFDDAAGKTRVTFRQTFETAAECAKVKVYAVDANEQNMDRLAAELQRMAGAEPVEVVLERTIDAPRERVFAAWTTPEAVKRWFAPRPFELVVHQLDFRPGGRFRMAMRGPDGSEFPFTGRYREIVAPERLVWTGEFATGPAEQITTVVTFEAQGEKTKVHVRQTFHVVTPEIRHAVAGANQGWGMTLDQLAEVCAAGPAGKG
jgi:uncharacterized protein YndB with AHSA1/START domain